MNRSKRICPLVLLLLLFSAITGFAQNRNTAELVGTVTDPSGAVVPGATVTITNIDTHVSLETQTNEAGSYDVPFLQPGRYVVIVKGAGFTTLRRDGLVLEVGQTARFNAALQIGRAEAEITVSATTALLGTDSTERATNLSTELVSGLPLITRDVAQLAALTPGFSTAQSFDSRGDAGRWSVNGSRAFSTAFTVNGGSIVLPGSNNFNYPPLAAVSEFSVISNNFSSEFGSGTSVLNMVTKSGTNEFHGSAFEYLQNDTLNARYFFDTKKAPYRKNQFGGTFGGPIKRDKLFFFFSYENTINPNSALRIATVPSAAVKAGNFSAYDTPVIDPTTGRQFEGNVIPTNRIDPVAKAVQSYFPDANRPDSVNNWYRSSPVRPTLPIYDAKVDYVLTPSNQITASAHIFDQRKSNVGTFPGDVCTNNEACGSEPVRDQSYQVSDRWSLTPQMVNEFRASMVREHFELASPSDGKGYPEKLGLTNVPPNMFPVFTMGGAVPTNIGPGNHYGGTQNVYSVSNSVLWKLGAHTLKFGGEIQKIQINSMANWNSGSFNFSGLFSGVGYADFLLGLPDAYSLSANPNALGQRRTAAALFLQDDYRISRNVTLNLGLRYQFEGGFSEAHDRLSNFNPDLINPAKNTPGAIEFASSGRRTLQENHGKLFAPRIGVAWSVSNGLVVRAAYGMFIIPTNGQNLTNSGPPGYTITQSVQTTDQHTPVFKLSDGPPPYSYPDPAERTPDILNGQGPSYWPFNAAQGYTQQWHFSIQKSLGANSMIDVAYVGTKASNLLYPRDLNQVPPDRLGPGDAQSRRPFPQYNGILAWYQDGYSNYNALQVQFKRRVAQGLTTLVNYTMSKALDNSTFELTAWGGMNYQIASNPGLNYGLASSDQTHRFVTAYVYDIPLGKGRAALNRDGIVDAVFGGWQTSGSLTVNTGAPFTVQVGGPDRTNSLAGWPMNPYADRLRDGTLPRDQRSLSRWFDTSAYVDPQPFRFGNAGRNTLRGPGYFMFDTSVMKYFHVPINERTRLQFRADFANIFNHPNFKMPNASTGSDAFGTITGAYSPRQIQLGLQFMF